jgi:hypothetical protein
LEIWTGENFLCRNSRNLRSADQGFVDDHARHSLAIRFLFRCVDAVRFRVDREAMDLLLNRKILQLPIVLGIIHLEDGSPQSLMRHRVRRPTLAELVEGCFETRG